MPSLKDLRNRISSVKSTKKITSAMKMVAAAKLKRAQDNAEKSRPYANKMKDIVLSLISRSNTNNLKFSKSNNKKTVLLIVCSADRGQWVSRKLVNMRSNSLMPLLHLHFSFCNSISLMFKAVRRLLLQ